ncbi:MAG: HAMP domain-containing sensor histidine kinase [bacterium]
MLSRHKSFFSARLLQLYFAIGILVLGGFWFAYSQVLLHRLSRLWASYSTTLSDQLEAETQVRSRIYAKFMSRATEPSEAGSPELDIIFEEVIKKIDFPVLITDARGRPTSTHRNLGVEHPDSLVLARIVGELDAECEPIPLVLSDRDTTRPFGMIHYGLSPSTRTLRTLSASLNDSVRSLSLFAMLQVFLLVGFVAIGVWGILAYKRREQEHIWTALAKETAHQLATPMSSLAAWLDILRGREEPETVVELEQDLRRMREVLDRFSRIGKPPELADQRVGGLITDSVRFVERRAPRGIRFSVEVRDDPVVRVDPVLFAWMLENLLKNGVDAVGSGPGEVAVRAGLGPDWRQFEIEVIDSGEGVKVERAFEAGVTTKPHGWGVGLALARRIVEDYHRGRLVLGESGPGRTVFLITLPVEPGRQEAS